MKKNILINYKKYIRKIYSNIFFYYYSGVDFFIIDLLRNNIYLVLLLFIVKSIINLYLYYIGGIDFYIKCDGDPSTSNNGANSSNAPNSGGDGDGDKNKENPRRLEDDRARVEANGSVSGSQTVSSNMNTVCDSGMSLQEDESVTSSYPEEVLNNLGRGNSTGTSDSNTNIKGVQEKSGSEQISINNLLSPDGPSSSSKAKNSDDIMDIVSNDKESEMDIDFSDEEVHTEKTYSISDDTD